MGAGRNLFGIGLLTILFLTLAYLYAEEEEVPAVILPGSRVTLSVDLHDISVGSPFSLSLLIDSPKPEDVSVEVPPHTGVLTIDRFVKTPRVLSANLTMTHIEYRFIPTTEGEFILGSFRVTTPQGITETQPVVLNIQRRVTGPGILNLQLRWEGAPRQTTAGERIILMLHVSDPRRSVSDEIQYPPPSFFMPQVPRGVILSQTPLSQQERDSGYVLKLTLIPLTEGEFNLPARNILQENIRYRIPLLRIPVTERER